MTHGTANSNNDEELSPSLLQYVADASSKRLTSIVQIACEGRSHVISDLEQNSEERLLIANNVRRSKYLNIFTNVS